MSNFLPEHPQKQYSVEILQIHSMPKF
nr:unnamed protein product [Callosobruchus chinensis]